MKNYYKNYKTNEKIEVFKEKDGLINGSINIYMINDKNEIISECFSENVLTNSGIQTMLYNNFINKQRGEMEQLSNFGTIYFLDSKTLEEKVDVEEWSENEIVSYCNTIIPNQGDDIREGVINRAFNRFDSNIGEITLAFNFLPDRGNGSFNTVLFANSLERPHPDYNIKQYAPKLVEALDTPLDLNNMDLLAFNNRNEVFYLEKEDKCFYKMNLSIVREVKTILKSNKFKDVSANLVDIDSNNFRKLEFDKTTGHYYLAVEENGSLRLVEFDNNLSFLRIYDLYDRGTDWGELPFTIHNGYILMKYLKYGSKLNLVVLKPNATDNVLDYIGEVEIPASWEAKPIASDDRFIYIADIKDDVDFYNVLELEIKVATKEEETNSVTILNHFKNAYTTKNRVRKLKYMNNYFNGKSFLTLYGEYGWILNLGVSVTIQAPGCITKLPHYNGKSSDMSMLAIYKFKVDLNNSGK